MEVKIVDGRLIVTPITVDEEKQVAALEAAFKAFSAVMWPISEPEERASESDKEVSVEERRELGTEEEIQRKLADLDALHSQIQRIVPYWVGIKWRQADLSDPELVMSLARKFKATLDRVIFMTYGISPNEYK
nr:MAG TPA: hypothetical protein [Caudoviricetes sp.]